MHNGFLGESAYQPADPDGCGCRSVGADLLLNRDLIQAYFPYLSGDVQAALHVRRAGWLSAQQLGMHLFEKARASGVHLLNGKVTGLATASGRVSGVLLQDGTRIQTECFVNAAGPFIKEIGEMLSLDLPVYHELHLKLAMKDAQIVLDRAAPLVICCDPQKLAWTSDEAAYLDETAATRFLLEVLPAGVHARPEGGEWELNDPGAVGIPHPSQRTGLPDR